MNKVQGVIVIFLLGVVVLLMVVTDTNPLLRLNVPDGIELVGDTALVRDLLLAPAEGYGAQRALRYMEQARHDIDGEKLKWLKDSGYYYDSYRISGSSDLAEIKAVHFLHVFVR